MHFMRAFVIGNGESLLKTPLELLIGQRTYATNRIHHLYDRVVWRPSVYVRTEPPYAVDPVEFFAECRWHTEQGYECVYPDGWQEDVGVLAGHVRYLPTCRHFKYPPPHKKAHYGWHLPVICDTSIITAAMQVAVLDGATEIVLLGCDLTGPHFSATDTGLIQTDVWQSQHEIAKRSCPVPIYNATVGGNLEIYERVNLLEML